VEGLFVRKSRTKQIHKLVWSFCSVYLRIGSKKNAFLAFPDKTDTQKNSGEQKKLRTEICIFAYPCTSLKKSQPYIKKIFKHHE